MRANAIVNGSAATRDMSDRRDARADDAVRLRARGRRCWIADPRRRARASRARRRRARGDPAGGPVPIRASEVAAACLASVERSQPRSERGARVEDARREARAMHACRAASTPTETPLTVTAARPSEQRHLHDERTPAEMPRRTNASSRRRPRRRRRARRGREAERAARRVGAEACRLLLRRVDRIARGGVVLQPRRDDRVEHRFEVERRAARRRGSARWRRRPPRRRWPDRSRRWCPTSRCGRSRRARRPRRGCASTALSRSQPMPRAWPSPT